MYSLFIYILYAGCNNEGPSQSAVWQHIVYIIPYTVQCAVCLLLFGSENTERVVYSIHNLHILILYSNLYHACVWGDGGGGVRTLEFSRYLIIKTYITHQHTLYSNTIIVAWSHVSRTIKAQITYKVKCNLADLSTKFSTH